MDNIEIPQIASNRKKRLSKSDYFAGLQCPKNLWLRIYEPDASELKRDEGIKAVFEQGRKVGELARAYVPGGTLIDFPYHDLDQRLAATMRSINEGAAILYEAAFAANGMFVAVDILERTASGFVVTEVKSSTRVHNEHLQELALQAYVLRKSEIEVAGLQLMHLNRDCAYPDLDNLFIRENVTEEVEPLISKVEEAIRAQVGILTGNDPVVQIGPHCLAPYECSFKNRCWADVPAHHVTTLYSTRANKAFELVEQGFTTIHELPSDFSLSNIADRQRQAVVEDRLIVEPTLFDALKEFPSSIGFLDFETVGPGIPVWDGCRPYNAVPVQFSFCSLQPDGTLLHSEWLADGPNDPREAIANSLIEACRGVERIAAYNAGFESSCLKHLADAVPHLAGELLEIDSRLVDLLPLVRNHIYHPEFYGSFGLKRVFPVMTEDSTYETLEIGNGALASWLLQALLLDSNRFTPEEKLKLRRNLLSYCRADTVALAKLLYKLRGLEASSIALRSTELEPALSF